MTASLVATISEADRAVEKWTTDDAEFYARFNPPAADWLDKWLVQVALGTTDSSDFDYNARFLLDCAIDRAKEITAQSIIECNEDHCWPNEEPYRERKRKFRAALAEIVAHRTPMVIAENSQWILGGLDSVNSEKGARHHAVIAAWEAVKEAVFVVLPTQTSRARYERMSQLERAVMYAR